MAHIIIEFSTNLEREHDITTLVDDVHTAALATEVFPLAGLRTRAHRCELFRVATGDEDLAFVAIVIRMGPGRSDEVKMQVISSVLDAAESSLSGGGFHISYSCEVQEIDAARRENRNYIRSHLQGSDLQKEES